VEYVAYEEPPKTYLEAERALPQNDLNSPPKTASCEEFRPIFEKYPWDVEYMLYICKLESGGNVNAVGDLHPINGLLAPSCGLMQIRTLSGRPSCEELKDPEINIEWAWIIYQKQGYRAWSVTH